MLTTVTGIRIGSDGAAVIDIQLRLSREELEEALNCMEQREELEEASETGEGVQP